MLLAQTECRPVSFHCHLQPLVESLHEFDGLKNHTVLQLTI